MPFTAEELEELRRYDAMIDAGFAGLTPEEAAAGVALDAVARREIPSDAPGKRDRRAEKAAYYQRNRERIRAKHSAYRAEHLEQVREYNRRYREAHREDLNEKARLYQAAYRKRRKAEARETGTSSAPAGAPSPCEGKAWETGDGG